VRRGASRAGGSPAPPKAGQPVRPRNGRTARLGRPAAGGAQNKASTREHVEWANGEQAPRYGKAEGLMGNGRVWARDEAGESREQSAARNERKPAVNYHEQ
jgi:hypothetical protein